MTSVPELNLIVNTCIATVVPVIVLDKIVLPSHYTSENHMKVALKKQIKPVSWSFTILRTGAEFTES